MAVADLGVFIGGFLITQTTKWEVVRICASQKRPFFFFLAFFTFSHFQCTFLLLQYGGNYKIYKRDTKKKRV